MYYYLKIFQKFTDPYYSPADRDMAGVEETGECHDMEFIFFKGGEWPHWSDSESDGSSMNQ